METPQEKPTTMSRPTARPWVKIALPIVGGIVIAAGAFFAGSKLGTTKGPQLAQPDQGQPNTSTSLHMEEDKTEEAEEKTERAEMYISSTYGISATFPTAFSVTDIPEVFQNPGPMIAFGPLIQAPEAPVGEMTRAYRFIVSQRRSAGQAKEYVEQDNLYQFKKIATTKMGIPMIQYDELGLCVVQTIEVIGEEYNYVIRPACGSGSQEEIDYMMQVVDKLELKQKEKEPVSFLVEEGWTLLGAQDNSTTIKAYPYDNQPDLDVNLTFQYFEKPPTQKLEAWIPDHEDEFQSSTFNGACDLLVQNGKGSVYNCGRWAAEYYTVALDGAHLVRISLGQDPALTPEELLEIIRFN